MGDIYGGSVDIIDIDEGRVLDWESHLVDLNDGIEAKPIEETGN